MDNSRQDSSQEDGQMAGAVAEITDGTFKDEVLNSNLPVVVDLWAPWCGPCRMQTPIVEQLAQKYQGALKVVKLNVDENPDAAGNLGVQSIPTLIKFENGKEVERAIGLRQLADLEKVFCSGLKPAQA